jgi:hypothetical protein
MKVARQFIAWIMADRGPRPVGHDVTGLPLVLSNQVIAGDRKPFHISRSVGEPSYRSLRDGSASGVSQALRTWLPSFSPYGTKRLALSPITITNHQSHSPRMGELSR